MILQFNHPCAFTSIQDLKDAVRDARALAEIEARRNCKGGILVSRGAWIIGLSYKEGDPVWSDGMIAFAGTYKQMNELLHDVVASLPQRIDEIHIEGGYNWAASMRYYYDEYEPWVSEWTVPVWSRKEHAA